MEEQSQPSDIADLARFGYKQELQLALTIAGQSLEWANDDYGLASSVWTRDAGCGRMARKPRFGTVWINTQSGYRRDMGIYSLMEYTQIKHARASHE